jgi:nitroreductase
MAAEERQSRLMTLPADMIEQLIFQRRSIRRYKSDALPEVWIQAMLACAHQAPSPSNCQPVRFVRIQSQICKDRLRQALAAGHDRLLAEHREAAAPVRLRNWINAYRRYSEFMFAAPVLLAVGIDADIKGIGQRLREAGLTVGERHSQAETDITVGLALKGLLLKAQALGVGSCILTAPLLFIQHAEKLLGLDRLIVKCFVTLGVADEAPKTTGRQPLVNVVRVV